MIRFVAAILLMPFLVFAFYVSGLAAVEALPQSTSVWQLAPVFIGGVVYALLVLALPMFLASASLGWLGVGHAALVGALTAASTVGLPAFAQLFDDKLRAEYRIEQFLSVYPWVLLGALSGVAFWLLALWRSPWRARLHNALR